MNQTGEQKKVMNQTGTTLSYLEPVFKNSTFLEIPIRFLGLKNFSERIQSLQVVGIPIGIPRNSGY